MKLRGCIFISTTQCCNFIVGMVRNTCKIQGTDTQPVSIYIPSHRLQIYRIVALKLGFCGVGVIMPCHVPFLLVCMREGSDRKDQVLGALKLYISFPLL